MFGMFGPTEGFKGREQQRQYVRKATKALSAGAITERFNSLTDLANPQIQSMLAQAGLIGGAQAGAARASLAREGFGEGTFVDDIGAGFQAGASFQGQTLQAKMMQELLSQAIGVQGNLAGIYGGVAGSVPQQPNEDRFDQAGKAVAAVSALLTLL